MDEYLSLNYLQIIRDGDIKDSSSLPHYPVIALLVSDVCPSSGAEELSKGPRLGWGLYTVGGLTSQGNA